MAALDGDFWSKNTIWKCHRNASRSLESHTSRLNLCPFGWRTGLIRHGSVPRTCAGAALSRILSPSWPSLAWPSLAWHSLAWHSLAWPSPSWPGVSRPPTHWRLYSLRGGPTDRGVGGRDTPYRVHTSREYSGPADKVEELSTG